VSEFATDIRHIAIDHLNRLAGVSAIVGWREAAFVEAYDGQGASDGPFASAEPRRARRARARQPRLFSKRAGVSRGNTFKVKYLPFDWSLNDLTGGRR